MESSILTALEFDVKFTTPVTFLERFQRIFGLDREKEDPMSKKVGTIARKCCRFMLIRSHFLEFSPSQIAAVSLLFAI